MSTLDPATKSETQAPDPSRVCDAFDVAASELVRAKHGSHHWTGELSSSALSTATAISALSVVISAREEESDSQPDEMTRYRRLVEGGLSWLLDHQNRDGGWGDTDLSYSNISTSMLVLAALELAGVSEQHPQMVERAQKYVERQGGIPGLRRRYGKDKTFAVPILSNCAIAGQVDWKEVSPLPFEAAWVPQRFYRWMQLPVVSYAIPALVAIGQARFFHRKPLNPITRLIRSFAVRPTMDVLLRMQPGSGGYLEAIPLTCFVMMGLASTGRHNHEVTKAGLRFVESSVRPDGSWPIDTNLATWNTTLSINALASGFKSQNSLRDHPIISDALHDSSMVEWLLDCQYHEQHPFTGAAPGGWGWSDLTGAVPDADDTPGALLALGELERLGVTQELGLSAQVHRAVLAGTKWLLDLQNSDGGWPTFCRGWGKLPFDRSGSDLTAHVLRAFQNWESILSRDAGLSSRVEKATRTGKLYLQKNQRADGAWVPLWFGNQDIEDEENPMYGTSKVLYAYRDLNLLETSAAQRGLSWLASNQNPDGGWGGGISVAERRKNATDVPEHEIDAGALQNRLLQNRSLGISSVEETALGLEAMIAARGHQWGEGTQAVTNPKDAIHRGTEWLCAAVESGEYRECSPIGFYFAKLWYYEQMYPLVFTVSALGKAVRS